MAKKHRPLKRPSGEITPKLPTTTGLAFPLVNLTVDDPYDGQVPSADWDYGDLVKYLRSRLSAAALFENMVAWNLWQAGQALVVIRDQLKLSKAWEAWLEENEIEKTRAFRARKLTEWVPPEKKDELRGLNYEEARRKYGPPPKPPKPRPAIPYPYKIIDVVDRWEVAPETVDPVQRQQIEQRLSADYERVRRLATRSAAAGGGDVADAAGTAVGPQDLPVVHSFAPGILRDLTTLLTAWEAKNPIEINSEQLDAATRGVEQALERLRRIARIRDDAERLGPQEGAAGDTPQSCASAEPDPLGAQHAEIPGGANPCHP